jgi:hypothetical protein
MYTAPAILASLTSSEILATALGGNPGCGNEGNGKGVGFGSCASPV